MPIREYKCLECEHEFESLEGVYERASKCESCGGKVESRIGTPMLVFKGDGFYCTDYGKKAHWLEPKQQAKRAARECRKADLKISRPRKYSESESEKLIGNKPKYFLQS